MPTTIRGVIAARIDRLDAERRLILQEASVIGREFLFTILSQVSGGEATLADGLSALESADLIRKRDVDADLEYLFKHALTQEVAYQGLLRSKRHELHGRVGQAMEKLLGDRNREYAESIAYHFQNSDTPERAVPYLVIAGKKAIERYALAEAETYYQASYEVLVGLPRSAPRDRDMLELMVEWELLHYYTHRPRSGPPDEPPRARPGGVGARGGAGWGWGAPVSAAIRRSISMLRSTTPIARSRWARSAARRAWSRTPTRRSPGRC